MRRGSNAFLHPEEILFPSRAVAAPRLLGGKTLSMVKSGCFGHTKTSLFQGVRKLI